MIGCNAAQCCVCCSVCWPSAGQHEWPASLNSVVVWHHLVVRWPLLTESSTQHCRCKAVTITTACRLPVQSCDNYGLQAAGRPHTSAASSTGHRQDNDAPMLWPPAGMLAAAQHAATASSAATAFATTAHDTLAATAYSDALTAIMAATGSCQPAASASRATACQCTKRARRFACQQPVKEAQTGTSQQLQHRPTIAEPTASSSALLSVAAGPLSRLQHQHLPAAIDNLIAHPCM